MHSMISLKLRMYSKIYMQRKEKSQMSGNQFSLSNNCKYIFFDLNWPLIKSTEHFSNSPRSYWV